MDKLSSEVKLNGMLIISAPALPGNLGPRGPLANPENIQDLSCSKLGKAWAIGKIIKASSPLVTGLKVPCIMVECLLAERVGWVRTQKSLNIYLMLLLPEKCQLDTLGFAGL